MLPNLEDFKKNVSSILNNSYFKCSFVKANDLINKLHDEYGYLVSHDLMLHRSEECNIKINKNIIDYVPLNDTDELKYSSILSYEFILELLDTVSKNSEEAFNGFFVKKSFNIYYDAFTNIDLLFLLDKHKNLFKDIKNYEIYEYITINSSYKYPLFRLDATNFKALLNLRDKLKYTYND